MLTTLAFLNNVAFLNKYLQPEFGASSTSTDELLLTPLARARDR